MDFKELNKRIESDFPTIKLASQGDANVFLNVCDLLREADIVSKDRITKAYSACRKLNLQTKNDYYHTVFAALTKNDGLAKVAHPQTGGQSIYDFPKEYDLSSWANSVNSLFEFMNTENLPFDIALNKFSNRVFIDPDERDGFKSWLSYYQKGEHLKYSSNSSIPKKVAYQFGPISGFYENSAAKDSSGSKAIIDAKAKMNKNREYKIWKKKLHSTVRRLDLLLRNSDDYIDQKAQNGLAEALHRLDLDVRKVRLTSTASDLSVLAANIMKKSGFEIGHNALLKLAQELPDDTLDSVPEFEAEEPGGSAIGVLESGEAKDTINDALNKLETVSSALSSRDLIRNLAEFDILLDKIGIASLFPELSEAQSKLIDAYSYALVRVTSMLGMLTSGKSISDISSAKSSEQDKKMKNQANKVFETGDESSEAAKVKDIQDEVAPADVPGQVKQAPPVAPADDLGIS